MLIRTNPAKAVPALLNQVTSETDNKSLLEQIEWVQHHFPAVNEWQEELLDHFTDLDRHLRKIDGNKISKLNDIVEVINQIKKSLSKLETKSVNNRTDPVPERRISWQKQDFEISETEKKIIADKASNPTVQNLRVSYDRLEKLESRICLLFLAIFPENAVLKKRIVIYWWIGEGLITTEKEGEDIFAELLKLELIRPYGNGKSPIVSKCQIHPWVRYLLTPLAREAQVLDFDNKGQPRPHSVMPRRAFLIQGRKDLSSMKENGLSSWSTIFNLNESYLSLDSEWLTKLKNLVVLQLGRWQDYPHHHIEVQDETFLLKGLRGQKHIKYMSLRGISRITEIPRSIVELVSLEILDLRACHNLQSLTPNISSLKKLTHLDVSECYLLEGMPKTLDKLYSLQVLKGFIIGNSNKSPCKISDLTKLKELKRLSIHIGIEASSQTDVFKGLNSLTSLESLKISWGVENPVDDQSLSLPSSLKKLDLEGIPHGKIPEWLKPSKLKEGQLNILYIKGGKLDSLDHGEEDKWKVEILRIKYMKDLKIESLDALKKKFPSLKYVRTDQQIQQPKTTEDTETLLDVEKLA